MKYVCAFIAIDPLGLCASDDSDDLDWTDYILPGILIGGDILLGGPSGEGIGPALAILGAKKAAKEAAKEQFRKEAAGLETKVIRSGRDGTGEIIGVGTGKGGSTYRPKGDGSYSVGKSGDVKHFRPDGQGGYTVNKR